MTKCVLDACCYCIDLKIGSLFIGYCDLIGTLFMMVAYHTVNIDVNYVKVAYNGNSIDILDRGLSGVETRHLGYGIAIALYVLTALRIVFDIALLVGLHTNRRCPVAAYLIYDVVQFISYVAVVVVCFTMMFFDTIDTFIEMTTLYIVILCLTITSLPILYFWWVILSQYYEMGPTDNQAGQRPLAWTSARGREPSSNIFRKT